MSKSQPTKTSPVASILADLKSISPSEVGAIKKDIKVLNRGGK